MRTTLFFLLTAAFTAADDAPPAPKKLTFKSKDGLEITADLYRAHDDPKTPLLVLFHQAGWSRGEYREIAPKLNALGYNCLAVDQRSGGTVNGVPNETAARAQKKEKGTTYLDARQDVIAALEYARKELAHGPVIAWGSSYSSSLVLQVAGEHGKLVDGALSFAPGEYFQRFGKPATWIRDSVKKLKKPVFLTSAKREKPQWAAIFQAIPKGKKTAYLPETQGNHGSRALWEQFDDHEAYWTAVKKFLKQHFPAKQPAK